MTDRGSNHVAPRCSFPRAQLKRNDARVTTTTPARNLERITAPNLAISAKDDLYSTAGGVRYAAEQIPGARLILFPTGGHAWLGHDAVVRDEVATFLRRATSSQ
jgi:2-hydroxy-6-oxonona-2,4-dienedioate hydrolase